MIRVGLVLPPDRWPAALQRAAEADDAGVPAVLVSGPPGTEAPRAAAVAARTRWTRVAVELDLGAEDPVALAEEVAVLDNLAAGRVIVVARNAGPEALDLFTAALEGRTVRGVRISPPPAQPVVPVWVEPPILGSGWQPADLAAVTASRAPLPFVVWDGALGELAAIDAPPVVVDLARQFR